MRHSLIHIETSQNKSYEISKILRYTAICVMSWTVLLMGSFISRFYDNRRAIIEIGNSVKIPLDSIAKTFNGQLLQETFIHIFVWLVGMVFILIVHRKIVNTLLLLRIEQNRLLESEVSYHHQFANNSSIMLLIDSSDGRVIDANFTALAFYGYSREELLEMHVFEIKGLPASEVSRYMDSVTFEHGMQFESQHRIADGSIRCVEESLSRIQYGQRQILHLIVFDITERKRAEKALDENRNQLKDIIEFLPDATFAIDMEKRVIIWNRAIEEMTGVSAEAMIGKDYNAYSIPFYGESRPQLIDLVFADSVKIGDWYPNVTREGETLIVEVFCKSLYKNKGGWAFAKASPLHDQYGNIIGAIESIRDITEFKRIEEERQQLEQQFHHAQKLESLGVLAGGIAHDFNNILTIILGHCDLASKGMELELRYIESIQIIESAANRAADLCQQMLTYAGRTESKRTMLNLFPLLDADIKMLTSGIGKNVTLMVDLERDIPKIEGDSGQIQQIIMNLIINAAEAIGDNIGTIKVSLSKRIVENDHTETDIFGSPILSGSYACLVVADTGCGMDAETKMRLFEPFYTTKFTGRGLGMSAIRGIVKSHNGALQLSSMSGVGSTFRVLFPLCEAFHDTAPAPTVLSSFEKVGGNIMLVDDEEIIRDMGIVLLNTLGYSVITAHNGSEALEIYRDRGHEIDVVLMDLTMPVMGGIEAYYEIRKLDHIVPIVFCSGYNIESVSAVTSIDENTEFVKKPYTSKQLRDVLVKARDKKIMYQYPDVSIKYGSLTTC